MTSDANMMGWRTFAASRADPDLLAQIPGSTDHTISKQTIAELAGIASSIAGNDPSKFMVSTAGDDRTPLATSDIWAQAATEWIRREADAAQADFLDHLWDEDGTAPKTDQIDIEDIPEPPPVLTADMVKRMMDYRRYMKGYRRGQRRGGYYRGRGSYGYRRGGYNGYYRRGRY